MKARDKNFRRHYHKKNLNKVRRMVREIFHIKGEDEDKVVCKFLHQRKPCSCMACGNPRRYFGEKTLQEIKSEIEE